MKQRTGLIHARVQHFFFYISSHNFFLISLGQANIFLQGILGQYCRSSRNPFQNNSLEFQGITHSYQRVFFPRDNAEYDSQAVKSEVQYKPYRAWKEH